MGSNGYGAKLARQVNLIWGYLRLDHRSIEVDRKRLQGHLTDIRKELRGVDKRRKEVEKWLETLNRVRTAMLRRIGESENRLELMRKGEDYPS